MTTVKLKIAELAEKRLIPEAHLDAAGWPQLEVEQTAEGMLLRMHRYVTVGGEQHCFSVVNWPASWWQAFKHEVLTRLTKGSVTPFGKWLDRKLRESIRWEEHRHDRVFNERICPHLPVESWMRDPYDRHVEWLETGVEE